LYIFVDLICWFVSTCIQICIQIVSTLYQLCIKIDTKLIQVASTLYQLDRYQIGINFVLALSQLCTQLCIKVATKLIQGWCNLYQPLINFVSTLYATLYQSWCKVVTVLAIFTRLYVSGLAEISLKYYLLVHGALN
jgi:hypothetical protein